jgi:hypothetical protein
MNDMPVILFVLPTRTLSAHFQERTRPLPYQFCDGLKTLPQKFSCHATFFGSRNRWFTPIPAAFVLSADLTNGKYGEDCSIDNFTN